MVELIDGRGGNGGGGAKSYDGEKALYSTNHLILSGIYSLKYALANLLSKKHP
jgi:hypothetical protein